MEEFEAIPELYLRKILPISYEHIVEGCMHKDSTIYPYCDKLDFWKQKLEYDMGEMSTEKFFLDSCIIFALAQK